MCVQDIVHFEGGLPARAMAKRVAACAVISNPLAGQVGDDVSSLFEYGAVLGDKLARIALGHFTKPIISYGKAVIVGTDGDVEHGAAIIHPRMGKAMRAVVGGGAALVPSNIKIGSAGAAIDVPLSNKDDAWSFDEIDTITMMVGGAPRPNEMVVIVALADGGRPRARVSTSS